MNAVYHTAQVHIRYTLKSWKYASFENKLLISNDWKDLENKIGLK